MAPIRVALTDLSASAGNPWAAEVHLPYLLSSRGKSHYTITALLNSSVPAAEKARSDFGLPNSVKAYGSPEDVAADPDIDLLICCIRVDFHYPTVLPRLKAGKTAFTEWPLASNLADAETLAAAATQKSIIGFQGRLSPSILRVHSLLAKGTIGNVLSSVVHAYHNIFPAGELPRTSPSSRTARLAAAT